MKNMMFSLIITTALVGVIILGVYVPTAGIKYTVVEKKEITGYAAATDFVVKLHVERKYASSFDEWCECRLSVYDSLIVGATYNSIPFIVEGY